MSKISDRKKNFIFAITISILFWSLFTYCTILAYLSFSNSKILEKISTFRACIATTVICGIFAISSTFPATLFSCATCSQCISQKEQQPQTND
ncbi:MAG: hypothetical protein HRK26_01845 [Rickettsiaceae bacterium H1]|nr:hypothetical protein [Rickettsiaceae bacterium H1]